MTWSYKPFSGCDSKAVLYLLICINYGFFYIEQTEELKKRIQKHKSVANHSNNNNCNKESHWLSVSATKLFGYYSRNIKMRNINYC